ncbi:MAG: 23S rRNA (adenine(2503)-C(2))-methyltransferase RlmN [Phycisphaerales bacterium]
MNDPVSHIFDFTPATLGQWCSDRGMPAFRSKQILEWVYEKGIIDPALMTTLSQRDRALLADPEHGLTFLSGDIVQHQAASDGVQKLLVQWHGGRSDGVTEGRSDEVTKSPSDEVSLTVLPHSVTPSLRHSVTSALQTECVMIPAERDEEKDRAPRFTACISSQIGCPVGCKFCASGLGGLDGNLSAGRIVEQVWRLARLEGVRRITNVVFMGMGEPLANFGPVTQAIRTLATLPPGGMGISARKITISTVGLPAAIERLADQFELPVTLALSLHAPFDDLRRELIPWAQYSTIKELLASCQKWFEKTGREITLEYTLLGGVNDRPEHAAELARLAQTLRANVNLIRYNEVKGMPFQRPRTDHVHAFQALLRDRGVNVHIRASRGRDIAAACGQLRHEAATV